ncbi:NAD(P)H-quinone oxidoreductase [Curvivirga aplysinae]|uniref:NAD(P)H-quinone oxidoreductase n=1 Tax=Curvivirga aplysinae TaxID=2529852 RepID=UPI001C3FAB8D|nr:NAD(P)H-quinone oxidoreductase [Curvivirga aplysinae]
MTVPSMMQAVEISEAGGPEVLKSCTRPTPEIKAGEILIKVAAAGVNRPDCLQRAGLYPAPKDASDLPGLEVAGEVVGVGANVHQWEIGDKVCALTPGGGYAEYCMAPAGHALPWPKDYDAVKAAALPETFFTVWTNVFDRVGLQAGETLLVHGGSSGIGTTAIQLAKAFGAKIIITAGSDKKCDFCKELGADLTLNYKTQDWEAEVQSATDGKGVNVIFDMVGAPYMQKNLNCLAVEGRYALLAFLKGPKAELNMTRVLTDRLTITGSTLRPQSIDAKNKIANRLYERVWPLLNSGKVKPIIHSTFSLEEADKAHALMESSDHMGKIILKI